MSTEKNPEVVGCDASIMRNVWEIREREYNQKAQHEQERQDKSALPTINEDWANRLAARQGQYYKRVEKKAKTAEDAEGDSAVPKTRKLPVPRVAAPAPNQRATLPQRGLPAQTKGKKGQEQGQGKMHLLMNLPRTQPSAMVWGKSWKFSKDLAQREEGTTHWGHCWMFATQQPFTETGKPWPNGPCQIDPTKLHLMEKPVFRVPEEEPVTLCCDEWEGSWRNANKANQDGSSGQETEKYGFFTSLIESHCRNNDLYSSEWSDGWQSTKPSDNEGLSFEAEDVTMETEKGSELSTEWAECWKISNHHGLTSTPQVRPCHNAEWSHSWRASMTVQNNHQSEGSASKGSAKEDKAGGFGFTDRNKSSCLLSDMDKEFKAFPEWTTSWQVPKNNTKPSVEIEKTLKTEPPRMGQQPSKVQEKPRSSTLDLASMFIQLKASVLLRPRREVTHSMMVRLRDLEKVSVGAEWKDSWKMLKHRLRVAQRQRQSVVLTPFEENKEKEWKDSWKLTNPALGQNPEMWQQGWTITPQIRIDRAREQNHFPHVELPKNGPTGERNWNESWRMSRRQLEASRRSATATSWQAPRQVMRSAGDWQEAWMVSETQHRRDKPSYAQWMDAWKSSAFQSGSYQSNQQLVGVQWLKDSLEIKAKKEIISVQSVEKKMFHERLPDKQWIDSWKVASMLQQGASDGKANVQAKMGVSNEYGSKWGMSFRLANPMPKVDQPWVRCSPNPCYYGFMWAKPKRNQSYYHVNTEFTRNTRIFLLWAGSPLFLQSPGTKAASKAKPKGLSTDPRVIMTKKIDPKKHLYLSLEKKDKQMDKKWAGCHLLGKTQPRPKRGAAVKKVDMAADGAEKFEEEWAESWRFLVRMEGLKKKVKSLKGWEEAWKFLIPPYQIPKGSKAK